MSEESGGAVPCFPSLPNPHEDALCHETHFKPEHTVSTTGGA
jgi:hypothetical protein